MSYLILFSIISAQICGAIDVYPVVDFRQSTAEWPSGLITAEEALKMSARNKEQDFTGFEKGIAEAIRLGENSADIRIPWGNSCPKAAAEKLKSLGYKIKNPDYTDKKFKADWAYCTVSWGK